MKAETYRHTTYSHTNWIPGCPLLATRIGSLVALYMKSIKNQASNYPHPEPPIVIPNGVRNLRSSLARIHRRTRMDGVRAAEGGG